MRPLPLQPSRRPELGNADDTHSVEIPLLPLRQRLDAAGDDTERDVDADADTDTATTPPYAQIIPLTLGRIAQGMIYSVIFPYVNEMVLGFCVEEANVGVWSAIAESSMMGCEILTAPLYGVLADVVGRRPVLLACLVLWAGASFAFGWVDTLVQLVVGRLLLGLLCGAGLVARMMCAESCTPQNRVKAFAIFSPGTVLGVTLGPVVGGLLSKPVPRLFGTPANAAPLDTRQVPSDPASQYTGLAHLFAARPYLLPPLVVGSTALMASAVSFFYLGETMPPALAERRAERHGKLVVRARAAAPGLLRLCDRACTWLAAVSPRALVWGRRSSRDTVSREGYARVPAPGDDLAEEEERHDGRSRSVDLDRGRGTTSTSYSKQDTSADDASGPSWSALVRYAPYRIYVLLYICNDAARLSLDGVFPLFAYTRVELGGLGLETPTIGFICAVSATLSVLVTMFVSPGINKRLPSGWMLPMCTAAYMAYILVLPLIWASRPIASTSGHATAAPQRLNLFASPDVEAHSASMQQRGPLDTRFSAPLSLVTVGLLGLLFAIRSVSDFGRVLLDACIADFVPSAEHLARGTAVVYSLGGFGRMLGPLVISALFSFSASARERALRDTSSSPAATPGSGAGAGASIVAHAWWILAAGLMLPLVRLAWAVGRMMAAREREQGGAGR